MLSQSNSILRGILTLTLGLTIASSVALVTLFSECSLHASPYERTVEQIEEIYARTRTHAHEDFLNVDIVRSPIKLKELLSDLVENHRLLSQMSAYYHPVGFIKLVLYKGRNGEQLRLHFWGQGGDQAIQQEFCGGWEPIHNHRWNFSSKVIEGGLMAREYTGGVLKHMTKTEAAFHRSNSKSPRICEIFKLPPRKAEADYRVVSTGVFAAIGMYEKRIYGSGSAYYLPNSALHQVQAEANTSTLLLLDPPAKAESKIYLDQDERFQQEFELDDLDLREIQDQLRSFLERF